MELYKKVSIPYNQEKLKSVFLSRWDFPPKESQDVLILGAATILVIANHANLDWGLDKFFNALGLPIEDIGIYISQPGHFPPPHTDGSSSGETREWGLNFPLMNCDKGYTTWHSYPNVESETISSKEHSGSLYNKTYLDPNKNELARIQMDGAYMIKTNVLHSIDNRENEYPRAVLSFRFKDVSWEEGKELLCP